jgi:hypothetical protein
MTKQVTRMAGAVAAATSRRGFLGRLARLAGEAAAGAAGLLAATSARAGKSEGKILCCRYITAETIEYSVCRRNKCPERMGGWRHPDWLIGWYEVSDCSECGY